MSRRLSCTLNMSVIEAKCKHLGIDKGTLAVRAGLDPRTLGSDVELYRRSERQTGHRESHQSVGACLERSHPDGPGAELSSRTHPFVWWAPVTRTLRRAEIRSTDPRPPRPDAHAS